MFPPRSRPFLRSAVPARRVSRAASIAAVAVLLAACAAPVAVPVIPPSPGAGFDAGAVAAPPADRLAEATPFPAAVPPMPAAGERHAFGGVTSEPLAAAWAARQANDIPAALAAADAAAALAAGTGDALGHWLALRVRIETLLTDGRAAEAETLLPALADAERAWAGHDLDATAWRGEVLVWIGDLAAAWVALAEVATRTAGWRLPVAYGGPPTNLGEIVLLTTAQLRAQTALAALAFLEGDAARARAWADAAEARYSDVHYVAAHPLYGPHLPTHYDSFHGRALNLAVLAAAGIQQGADGGEAAFARAREAMAALGWPCGTPMALALRAQALLAAGRAGEAVAAADAATGAATERNCADFVWRVEVLRGEALLADGRGDAALEAFRRAQRAVEAVTGGLAGDAAKLRFGIGKETITRRLADLLAARGDLPALFDAVERGRARAFVDLLARQPLGVAAGDDDVVRIRALADEVRIARLKALAPAPDDTAAGDLAALLAERDRRLAALARRAPGVAGLLAVAEPDLAGLRGRLGPGDVLLEALPLPGDETPVRWLAVTREGLALHAGTLRGRALGRLMQRFVRAGLVGEAGAQDTLLRELKDGLGLAPALGRGGPAGTVYVVPSGPLHRVPWGAVVADRVVAVLPTASLLDARARPARAGAVVVGDPDFGGALPPLPGARAEAQRVGALTGAAPLIGAAATVPAVRGRVGAGVGVLHLATHGTFDPLRPLESAVHLASAPLTARALFREPLSADLVVLSACETGLGTAVAGDDYLGLARSFYLAGARTLVHSLWPVADAPTRTFMEVFHERARAGDAGAAWRAATDALAAAGFPPFIAGAFTLGGLPGPG